MISGHFFFFFFLPMINNRKINIILGPIWPVVSLLVLGCNTQSNWEIADSKRQFFMYPMCIFEETAEALKRNATEICDHWKDHSVLQSKSQGHPLVKQLRYSQRSRVPRRVGGHWDSQAVNAARCAGSRTVQRKHTTASLSSILYH